MAKKVRIKWKQQVLEMDAVGDLTQRQAERIAAACGAGYEARQGARSKRPNRWVVMPVTAAAIRDNARSNTILRNIGAGSL